MSKILERNYGGRSERVLTTPTLLWELMATNGCDNISTQIRYNSIKQNLVYFLEHGKG